MLHRVRYPLGRCADVREFLLRLYANSESRKASLPAIRVSAMFSFLKEL